MAYVDGFEHDIFLSYSSVDDGTAMEGADGWVTAFEKRLLIALNRRVGRNGVVKIWRDRKRIQGHHLFDQRIEDAVNASAVFLALTSQGYLVSSYCRAELAMFNRKAPIDGLGQVINGDQRRIFNMLLTNLERGEWPEEYDGTVGFDFHDAEDDAQIGEPSEPDSALFNVQLRKLADALYKLLKALKEAPRPAAAAAANERAVFLAAVPDTLSESRQRVVNDLESRGIRVISGVPPTIDDTSHDQRVIEDLKRVALSVHLLDAEAGRYPRRQVELAIEHAKTQMIWVPQVLSIETVRDAAYRHFLEGLETGGDPEHTYDLVRSSPADITHHIREKLGNVRRVLETEAVALRAAKSCLLVTHEKDTLHMLPIAEVLLTNGYRALISQEVKEPKDLMTSYKECLSEAASLIVFYGTVPRNWVSERIKTARKHAVLEDLVLKLGVFNAPPEKQPDEADFSRPPVQVHLMNNVNQALAFVRAQ